MADIKSEQATPDVLGEILQIAPIKIEPTTNEEDEVERQQQQAPAAAASTTATTTTATPISVRVPANAATTTTTSAKNTNMQAISIGDPIMSINNTKMAVNNNVSSPASLFNCGTPAAPTSEEDNMDYDSDDDDDSKSNHSNSNINNSNRKRGPKGEIKRSHHNVLERKRRDLIKDSFTKLKEAVPTMKNPERASRAQILKRAADFIQNIHQRNESTRADIMELVKKNTELENRISSLEVKKEPTTTSNEAH